MNCDPRFEAELGLGRIVPTIFPEFFRADWRDSRVDPFFLLLQGGARCLNALQGNAALLELLGLRP